ncbi:uncharacterized protein [Montipora foliosa]|uniref:uncharacterized protein n=1 Tax=Montipora foliosa TaxID=591990 RepID=UPI0035F139C8
MRRSSPSLRLVTCLLNISEARNRSIVESIANAALYFPSKSRNNDFKCQSTVLNIFSDFDYNRSVITIAASVENIEESVFRACEVAYKEIDLARHSGGHPRLGSVDLVPIHTISTCVSLKECGEIAINLGNRIVSGIKGTSVFFFGHADRPLLRGLVERRKAVNWYRGKHGMDFSLVGWDLGTPPSQRYGCTGIGAIPYVTNCNVTIDCQDLEFGKEIAKSIRASTPGGLAGVQSMAFEHEGRIEIACNIEASKEPSSDGNFQYTHPEEIETKVRKLAAVRDMQLHGTRLVGFTPDEAYRRAVKALYEGNAMAWKHSEYRM